MSSRLFSVAKPAAGALLRPRRSLSTPRPKLEQVAKEVSDLNKALLVLNRKMSYTNTSLWAYWALYAPCLFGLAVGLLMNYNLLYAGYQKLSSTDTEGESFAFKAKAKEVIAKLLGKPKEG